MDVEHVVKVVVQLCKGPVSSVGVERRGRHVDMRCCIHYRRWSLAAG